MKQLTCEMCGSTELLKQDGVFVCQNCGCKYSVEEAKKMMIEGTVDVTGTVTVDYSASVEKYLQNARRALAKEDWDETEKYYNLVEQNEPSNIEAIFYSSYAKARTLLIDTDYYKREHAFVVLRNTVTIIDENFSGDDVDMIKKISSDIDNITGSNFIYKGNEKDKIKKTFELFINLNLAWAESLVNIAKKVTDKDNKTTVYNLILTHCNNAKLIADSNRIPKPEENYSTAAHNWLYSNCEDYKAESDKRQKAKLKDEKEFAELRIIEIEKEIEKHTKSINEFERFESVKSSPKARLTATLGISLPALGIFTMIMGIAFVLTPITLLGVVSIMCGIGSFVLFARLVEPKNPDEIWKNCAQAKAMLPELESELSELKGKLTMFNDACDTE